LVVKIRGKIFIDLLGSFFMTNDNKFWNRNSKHVAKDLVGKAIWVYDSLSNITSVGVIIETDSYDEAMDGRGNELFSQKSGLLGMFSSRRGSIPTITAHAPSRTGLITLRKVLYGTDNLGPKGIAEAIEISSVNGFEVGTESGIYIGDTGIDYKSAGLKVEDHNPLPSGSPANRTGYFSLKRA
jgi:hypothetical protein